MIPSLTGLRFYAALLVFLSHLYLFNYFFGITEGLAYDFLNKLGQLGVSLFFVLSGFVLYMNYLPSGSKKYNLKSFYLARFSRIYPMFALSTLMVLPIEILSPKQEAIWEPLLYHLGLIHCFDAQACSALNSPSWSISVEAFFYLLFPVFGLLFASQPFRNISLALLLYLIALFTLQVVIPESFYTHPTFPPNRIGEFLLGMATACFYTRYHDHGIVTYWGKQEQTRRFAGGAILLLFLTMISEPLLLFNHPFQNLFFLFYAPLSALIILILALIDRYNRSFSFLTTPWIILGGEISYSFYLLHQPIMRYLLNTLRYGFHVEIVELDPILLLAIAFLILVFSILSSYWLYKQFEVPSKQWILEHFLRSRDASPMRKAFRCQGLERNKGLAADHPCPR